MRTTPLMLAIALGLGLGLPAPSAEARSPAIEDVRARDAWIVVFDEAPAASFRGFAGDSRRPKLAATSPRVTGAPKYDARSDEARAYAGYLAQLRERRLADMATRLGRPVHPDYIYTHATNGVALTLTAAEASVVRAMPGVLRVDPDFKRQVQTSKSPQWIGADEIWNGSVPGVGSHRGEGIIVGVIDTGIYRAHTAFAGTGISNPLGGFRGFCASNAGACNSKLIGLWDFTSLDSGIADPVDNQGHGTHVAATAAGNAFLAYSGVAPRANIIAYKGCPDDECNGVALLKAIDQAVADGVDVINYSIGSGPSDPWTGVQISSYYDDTEAFLAAREAGIVVAAAAGNDGSDPGTLSFPSNAPWVMSVANASHDTISVAQADRLADSSGRGPVIPFGVVKPDVTAPGTSVISAGLDSPTSTATKTGTSMATPHVAGAAALLKSTNPALTADQIVSALMLTARNSVKVISQIADPHEQGAGMIDVAKAARAGLYQEIPGNAFRLARANVFDGAAEALNLPSFGDGACFRTCTLTRTFKLMPGAAAASYSVAATTIGTGFTITPSVTTFSGSAAGTPLSITVNVDNPAMVNRWAYGWVTLTNTSGDGRPSLRLPVAVFATPLANRAAETAVEDIQHVATAERGYFDVEIPGMVALADARFTTSALAAPQRTTQNIAVDPTRDDPFDNATGTYYRTFSVPATALATTYRIGASTTAANPDIDLFVGRDLNHDGLPQAIEVLCQSASAASNEQCTAEVSTAAAATFWVVAQNWSGPGTGVTVESFVLPMTEGESPNLVVTGPGNVPAGTPFTIRVAYDDRTMLDANERFGVLFIKSSPTATMVSAPFTITRSGNVPAPFALAPAVARTVTLAAGTAHERLYVDIPPNATQVTFRTQNGTGSVSLYAARTPIPAGPVVAAAPARNAPGVRVANAAGANQTIVVSGSGLQAGRWYLTPVNTGTGVATVDVVATIDTVAAVPTLRRGSYYNPTRGGHGIFLYPSGTVHALIWYTYLQDGTPTWYYAQGPQPGANQVWNGAVYRAAWNGTSRTLEQIGNLVVTPSSATGLTMSYNIDGFTGAETMDTFLTGCPTYSGSPLDISAHWFDTASPGYGYSVQVHPAYEFLATFVYDGIGVPRFLAAERGGTFNGGNPTLPLDQLAGFAPLGPHSTPVRTTVGQLTRAYGVSTIQTIGTNATFVNGVPGTWARSATVTRLSDLTQGCN